MKKIYLIISKGKIFRADRKNRIPYYPVVAGYSSTIHKEMGQTIPHIILVFNCHYLSPTVGYVALSRLILSI